jgi:CubicO group peptidase (beta-lactamase class C family)
MLAGIGLAAGCKEASAVEPSLVGVWTGVLAVGPGLPLRLEIAPDGAVTLYSLDQGGVAIPGKAEALSAADVRLVFPSVKGRFEARLADGDRLEGVWRQGAPAPLSLQRGDGRFDRPKAAALDQTALAALRANAGSPALIAGARRGVASLILVDGRRSAKAEARATVMDRWHVGSITKSMTATLIARLAAAGLVSWDETVGDVLAAVAPQMREAYKPATFRHLLSHRAGLQANIGMVDFVRFPRLEADPRASRAKFASMALAQPPAAGLAEKEVYSNNGYVVAAAMIEAKLGAPWEALMREHVFAPLGLASARFGAPGTSGALDHPLGHSKPLMGGRKPHRLGAGLTDNPAVLGPAGTVHLSISDLLTYLSAHRDRTTFLPPEAWSTLHTPPFGGDYAMGWAVRQNGVLWHNGSNTLWYAEALIDRDRGLVAAAVANDGALASSQPAVAAALSGIAAAV